MARPIDTISQQKRETVLLFVLTIIIFIPKQSDYSLSTLMRDLADEGEECDKNFELIIEFLPK